MDSKIMDVLADRVLELGPKPEAGGPYRRLFRNLVYQALTNQE